MLASNRPTIWKSLFALIVLSLLLPAVVYAQTWSGPGPDWNTAGNWFQVVVPNSPSAAVLFAGSGEGTVNISSSVQAQSITFSPFTGGYTLTSNGNQTLSSVTGISNTSGVSGLQTINLATTTTGSLLFPSGNNLTVTNSSTSGATTLVIGPNTVIGTAGSGGVTVTGGGVTQITGSFATSPNNVVGGINKTGPGTLTFSGSGANLSGGFILNGGTLTLDYSSNTASKLSSGGLTLEGGVLSLTANSGTPVTQSISLGTSITSGATTVQGTGTGTITLGAGAITRAAGATVDFNLNVSPIFSVQTSTGNTNGLLGTGPAFATVNGGAGWATLSGSAIAPLASYSTNIYTSGANTDITAGSSQNNITTNSLRFNVPGMTLNLSGTNTIQSGGILVTPGGGGAQIAGASSTLTAPGNGEIIVQQYSNVPFTIGTALSSSAGLTKSGPGTLVLTGNNTGLTGPININRGSLTVSGSTATVNSSSAINFNDDRAGATLQTFTVALPGNTNGTISPPIRLSAFSNTSAPGTLFTTGTTLNSTITLSGVISSAPGLTTPIQFSGDSSDTSGFTLTNSNTFTGNVDLSHGSLGINSNASLGSATNTLILEVGDTQNGGLVFLNGGVNVARPVALNTATRIISNAADVNTISGAITGSGILVKTGTGTLILSGANNYGTATLNGALVNGGTLTIPTGGSLSTPGNILVGNSGVSGQNGTLNIDGTGSVTQSGSAFLQVGWFNTTTGNLNIGTTTTGASFTVGTGGIGIQTGSIVNVGNGPSVHGTLTSNGSVYVNGGNLVVGAGSTFNLGGGQTLNISSGQATFASNYDSATSSIYSVSGVGSKLLFSNQFRVTNGALANVTSGGSLSASNIDVGTNTGNGTLLVDGAGSSAVATSVASNWGLSGYTANVTFSNSATGSFPNGLFLADSGYSSVVNLTIKSAAQVTTGNLDVTQGQGSGGGNPSTTITISDLGSSMIVNGIANIGDSVAGDAGIINVQNNGSFIVNGGTNFFPTGTININGGTVNLGGVSFQGGQGGTINFNSGSLSYIGNLSVGPTSGILGADLNLGSNRSLTIAGTTTIDQFHTLTLAGGTFNTDSLVVNGSFAFNSGTLGITGASGLTIGTGSPLGASYSLGAGRTLNVSNNTTVASSGILYMNGGTFTASGGVTNNGEIQFLDTTSQFTGGTLTNNKLVDGNGRISNSLTNSSTGEVRASGSTQRLTFTGSNNTNSGKINLVNGGTVEFTNALTNNASGQIVGRGELIAASISNSGKMNFSAGYTDVYGPVTNNAGGSIIVSGGGTTTFWDPLANNTGGNIQVSSNSIATFEGAVTGGGTFSGPGLKIFDAGGGPPSVITSLATLSGSTQVEELSTVNVNQVNEHSLTVQGTMNIAPKSQGGQTVVTSGLEIDSPGVLDLANNAMVVNYTTSSPIANIRDLLTQGYNGGGWNGGSIQSVSAADDASFRTALGYAEASQLGLANGGTFSGQTIPGQAVLVKYTYYGDNDLDGKVTLNDFSIFVDGFNGLGTGWVYGDYDYNGSIDMNDFSMFVDAYKDHGAQLSSLNAAILSDPSLSVAQKNAMLNAVPEPTSLALILPMAMLMRRRKR